MGLTTESIVAHNTKVISSDLDSETIVLAIEDNRYYSMASTANRIWSLLETPVSIAEIIETLVDEFDISRTQCEGDILKYLGDLLISNLITVNNSKNLPKL